MAHVHRRVWWCEAVSLFCCWTAHGSHTPPSAAGADSWLLSTFTHVYAHTHAHIDLSESTKALAGTTVWTLFLDWWAQQVWLFRCWEASGLLSTQPLTPAQPTHPPSRLCVSFDFSCEVMWRQLICRWVVPWSTPQVISPSVAFPQSQHQQGPLLWHAGYQEEEDSQ